MTGCSKRWTLAVVGLLTAAALAGAQNVARGPYLQIGTPNSVVIKWRTDTATDSRVQYGRSPSNLNDIVSETTSTTEHEVHLSGLLPNTRYYYAIGTGSRTLAGGAEYYFVTAPVPGTPKSTRIWVIGDAGTKNASQRAVRDAYYAFTGDRHTDLWLMLGDNAYNNGLDEDYQAAVFDMYPELLRTSVVWPTRGNHDRGPKNSSGKWTNGGAYYDIFTLPVAGEAGGLPSGTEAYYAFDYGNIHFICLESTSSDLRSANGPMWTWLEEDLAANTQDWTIAFWHHPPYSKGSHNSDSESELEQMRERAVPILEDYGVDLVLAGHSHSYERSYLLDGHYGRSTTLSEAMILDKGDGREDGDGAYAKATLGPAPHEGAVYIVAGSSGKTSGGKLDHPAMFLSLDELGSVVVDIEGARLDAKFLDDQGGVRDYFTLLKGAASSGPATQMALVSGDNQVGTVGATLPNPLVVVVRDADNRPVSGVPIDFQVISGSGSLSQSRVNTAGNGKASVLLTLGNVPGEVRVAARADALAGSPVVFTVTATTGPTDTEPPAAPKNVRVEGGGLN